MTELPYAEESMTDDILSRFDTRTIPECDKRTKLVIDVKKRFVHVFYSCHISNVLVCNGPSNERLMSTFLSCFKRFLKKNFHVF